MFKRTLLTLSLTTALGSTFATGALPEIPWTGLSLEPTPIGQGGFGEVYKGRWKGLDVAVKQLSLRALPRDLIAEFERETQAMWQCQFTNVLRLLGICKEPGHYAMIVELMAKGSLYEILHSDAGGSGNGSEENRVNALTEKDRWDIAIRIAQGLDDLHKRGVIHGDLKSHNVLLDEHGRARISDFGLAKIKTTTSTAMTRSQGGSVRWSAPECFDDEPRVTNRSDIYSYGMILWELLTADIPFKQFPKEHIVMGKVHSGTREKIPDNCLPIWRELIDACWQQDPMRRPSAGEILVRLNATRPALPRSVWLPEETPEASNHASGYQRFPAAKGDWEKAIRYYQRNPVPGYDIGKVDVIWDPAKNAVFEGTMKTLQQRRGNPKYVADWSSNPDADWRTELYGGLASLKEHPAAYEAEDSPDVTLMPLWHGTQEEKLQSLLSAGYTAFCTTDDGYFGKGVYTTPDAAYAQMYANGLNPLHQPNARLILNWVVSYKSLPIVSGDYDRANQRLMLPVDPQYDARYVPVVLGAPGSTEYIPTQAGQPYFDYREFMTQNGAQVLPRYVVTLQKSLLDDGSGLKSQDRLMLNAAKEPLNILMSEYLVKKYKIIEEQERLQQKEELSRIKEMELKERTARLELEQWMRWNYAVIAICSRVQPSFSLIPEIARGHEEEYLQFLRKRLIYKPDPHSDAGKIELPIAALANPLGSTFDISGCGDSGNYLSFATGYRKGKNQKNANKVEVWIVPRFLVEKELETTAGHFREIMDKWPRRKTVGLIFTWGAWDDLRCFEYKVGNYMYPRSMVNIVSNAETTHTYHKIGEMVSPENRGCVKRRIGKFRYE